MKICKKHKKEFYGLRCPICTAPPVLHPADEEKLPFPGSSVAIPSETSDNTVDDKNRNNR